MEYFRGDRLDIRSKLNDSDIVTAADKASEDAIVAEIRKKYPEHSILSEESGGDKNLGDYRWVVDPLDGTTNFSSGLPNFCVSIGLRYKGETIVAVVFAPYLGELFTAVRGEGAYLNGKRIRTDEKLPLGESLAILVPPHRYHMYLHDYMMKMEKFYSFFSDMRSLGSAAISLCYVAAGRCSAYYELGLHIYDIAAGMLILSEAGGRISLTEKDGGWIDIAASSQQAYGKMMEIVDG